MTKTTEDLIAWAKRRGKEQASRLGKLLETVDYSAITHSLPSTVEEELSQVNLDRWEEFDRLKTVVREFALTQDEWLTTDPARKRLDTQKAREDKWALGPPLRSSEAGAILKVSPHTVKNWARKGRFKNWTKTLGGHFRFPRPEIIELKRKIDSGSCLREEKGNQTEIQEKGLVV